MADAPVSLDELVEVARQLREGLCAAMRVIAEIDTGTLIGASSETAQQRFVDEVNLAGLTDGFGARADDVIKKFQALRAAVHGGTTTE
jgi:hypothetical protein